MKAWVHGRMGGWRNGTEGIIFAVCITVIEQNLCLLAPGQEQGIQNVVFLIFCFFEWFFDMSAPINRVVSRNERSGSERIGVPTRCTLTKEPLLTVTPFKVHYSQHR